MPALSHLSDTSPSITLSYTDIYSYAGLTFNITCNLVYYLHVPRYTGKCSRPIRTLDMHHVMSFSPIGEPYLGHMWQTQASQLLI